MLISGFYSLLGELQLPIGIYHSRGRGEEGGEGEKKKKTSGDLLEVCVNALSFISIVDCCRFEGAKRVNKPKTDPVPANWTIGQAATIEKTITIDRKRAALVISASCLEATRFCF